jgi:hypothetical protein
MEQKKTSYPDLWRHVGSAEQLGSARRLTMAEGPGEGIRLIEICTPAGLRALFVESRALDLYELHFRGVNLGFISKNGLIAGRVQSVAGEFVRSWPAGFLATCGLRNVGPDGVAGDEYHPLHGRIGGMAAQNVCVDTDYAGGRIVLQGEMHETALFGYHLVLKRRIEISLSEPSIVWQDRIDNLTPADEPLFLLYHFNFGHPFLSPKTQLHVPPGSVLPRNEEARRGLAEFDRIVPPQDGCEEQVFFHKPLSENPEEAVVRLVNPALGITARLHYNTSELPVLAQWKSMRSTDYALGIEPCTSYLRGRAAEMAEGYEPMVPAFGSRSFTLRLELA